MCKMSDTGISAYQKASCTEPFGPIHHISMLLGIRDTAVILPLTEALPAGASSNRCHCPPSYQKASWTEPFGPIHHTSMLLCIRDTAAISPLDEALPAGASSNRCHCPP